MHPQVRIGRIQLFVDDEVVAKFHNYRGTDNEHVWFSGTVTEVDPDEDTCTVTFCDGDVSQDLNLDEVLFAPHRAEDWGKGRGFVRTASGGRLGEG